MPILWTALVVLALVITVVDVHYEMLRGISVLLPQLSIPMRAHSLVVIAGVLSAHLVEICLYAAGLYATHKLLGLGSIQGHFAGSALDYFYFSATTYSTLGVGDLFPTGEIRLIVGVEALNGFVLIGWSASFTYLSMQRSWEGGEKGHVAST
jgi:hypothetical protein